VVPVSMNGMEAEEFGKAVAALRNSMERSFA
jgi:hypothetical protein